MATEDKDTTANKKEEDKTPQISVVENVDGTVTVVPAGEEGDAALREGEQRRPAQADEDAAILRGLAEEDETGDATGDERLNQQGKDLDKASRRKAERVARRERQRRAAQGRDDEVRRLNEHVTRLTQTVDSLQSGQNRQIVDNLTNTIASFNQREQDLKDILEAAEATPRQRAEATAQLVEVSNRKARLVETHARVTAQLGGGGGERGDGGGARRPAIDRATAPAPDPAVVANGREWLDKHRWYNPQQPDQDTRVAMAVDHQMMQEGWDPRGKDYWDEFDERLSVYLRHRYENGIGSGTEGDGEPSERQRNGQDGDRKRRDNGGPRGPAGGGQRPNSGGNGGGSGYQLSVERVQAIKDAGYWDDAKLRARAIKRYQDYDAANRANN